MHDGVYKFHHSNCELITKAFLLLCSFSLHEGAFIEQNKSILVFPRVLQCIILKLSKIKIQSRKLGDAEEIG